jgi:sterol desaturase/sphingolipid hydroxylase (fatty acid hydroxylase superfamily)
MLAFIVTPAIGLALLASLFWFIERRWAAIPDMPRRRAGRLTDIAYYFMNQTLTRVVTLVVVTATVLAGAGMIGVTWNVEDLRALGDRRTFVTSLQFVVQAVAFIIVADFTGYWMHRLFHWQPTMWRVHAIHHSSKQVDWLAAVRVHPLNDVIANTVQALPLLLLGFSPTTLAGYVGFIGIFAIFLHSNTPWSYGPLKRVIASPVFHRWHHTTEREGIDKNFSGLLPFWDLIFGTYYMPEGRQPMEFGVVGEPVPEGLWRQLLYPMLPGRVLVDRAAA